MKPFQTNLYMNLKYCQIQVQMTQQIEIFLIEQIDNWWLLHEESNLDRFCMKHICCAYR